MEFGTNIFGSMRDRLGAGSSRAGSNLALLDWPDPHTGLTAAYEAGRALLDLEIGLPGPFGRFERNAAATISAASYASCRVKPDDLTDGKVSPCLAANIAELNIGD